MYNVLIRTAMFMTYNNSINTKYNMREKLRAKYEVVSVIVEL